jgi:hypothetical protein
MAFRFSRCLSCDFGSPSSKAVPVFRIHAAALVGWLILTGELVIENRLHLFDDFEAGSAAFERKSSLAASDVSRLEHNRGDDSLCKGPNAESDLLASYPTELLLEEFVIGRC